MSTSTKITALSELTDPASGDMLPVIDITETAGTDARNKRILLSTLAEFVLGGKLYDFSIASGSKAAVTVSFGETFSPAKTRAMVLGSVQTNADSDRVEVRIVPGSLSATEVQVIATSDNHTGIKGTVLVRD